MIKILFIAYTFIAVMDVSAQKIETIKITSAEYRDFIEKTQYKYPVYTRAKISFKNGDLASARINYNNFLHVMKYIGDKGDTLEITNAGDIDYIALGADTIFYDNAYYEWIASSPTARLAVIHTYKEAYRALVGAMGTSSPAKQVESVTKIFTDGTSSIGLSQNEVITILKETRYYISPINDTKTGFILATKKNIDNLFPKKKVENFVKEKKLNLSKEADLIDLMVYISQK